MIEVTKVIKTETIEKIQIIPGTYYCKYHIDGDNAYFYCFIINDTSFDEIRVSFIEDDGIFKITYLKNWPSDCFENYEPFFTIEKGYVFITKEEFLAQYYQAKHQIDLLTNLLK